MQRSSDDFDSLPQREQQAGVQSVETALRVLLTLTKLGAPRMLKTIAAAASMPPSKVHRYLVSFSRMGFVEREPTNGRYRLGPAALELGLAALDSVDVVRFGSSALARLCDEVDETVGLVVWGSAGPTFVRLEQASRPITINVKAGSAVPLLSSATGQVFAAFLPESLWRNFALREIALNRKSSDTDRPTSWAEAELLIDQVRHEGIARVIGQTQAGINGLSVPIFDHEGGLAAALTALGSAGVFDDSLDGSVAAALRNAGRRLSQQLGWRLAEQP